MLHAMFSAEPWTFHQPDLRRFFQTGETHNGASLIDYQHPHDLVVSASGRFEWPVSASWRFIAAGGAVDAPALGPEPFMHRASAEANPTRRSAITISTPRTSRTASSPWRDQRGVDD
jgi:hypothetical protein